MTTILTPDICVIGGGSGGLSVAAAAAAFGAPVALVEKGRMGGDCLNVGCVPSKALIAAARLAQAERDGAAFGLANAAAPIDWRRVQSHVRSVIAAIAPNDSAERFAALGVHVIKGEASFRDRRTVVVGDREIRARRFVLATGSRPAIPAIPGLDAVKYLTNETIFDLERPPGRLVVLGAGPIGVELAQAFVRLGSQVTVLDIAGALAAHDRELAGIVLEKLREEGVDLREHVKIEAVEARAKGAVRVILDSGSVEGTHLLVATGRRPDLDGLKLDAAGVAHDYKGIRVGRSLRTTNRRIYAVGDAAGGPQFTHAANYQAGLAIRAILFRLRARADDRAIPRVTFADPELAEIGLPEDEAARRIRNPRILRWPYSENDRARTDRQTRGFIKIIADRRGRILGAGVVGAGAGEVIGLWSLAIAKGLRLSDIATLVLPYPTMGEIGKRAALSFYAGKAGSPPVRRLVRLLRLFG